jgi:hypothetical protein
MESPALLPDDASLERAIDTAAEAMADAMVARVSAAETDRGPPSEAERICGPRSRLLRLAARFPCPRP